jgi:replication-associated recombination protein RarA
MKNLVIHPKTKQGVDIIIRSKPQSLLIVGPTGIGKKSLSEYIAESWLGIDDIKVYPYVITFSSDNNKAISIESIRVLDHFLSLKVPLETTPNRVALIHDGDKLTREAQNALLKTLEEPPENAAIILTASHDGALLPTIRSRVQKLNITAPSEDSLRELYKDIDDKQFNQAYLISGGLPGLLSAILEDVEHPLLSSTTDARSILSKDIYGRMLMINDLAKDQLKLMNTLQIMEQMAQISLARGANPKQWRKVLTASYEAYDSLSMNAQAKLTLLKLMFSL